MEHEEKHYSVLIDGFTAAGAGVAHVDGLAVFVPGVLPGERAVIRISQRRKNFAIGELLKVQDPSAARTAPLCTVYQHCGGCLLQHAGYPEQLRLKRQLVVDALRRIGAFAEAPVAEVLPSSDVLAYRNRISYHVQADGDALRLGFYATRSKDFIAAPGCLLPQRPLAEAAQRLPEVLKAYPDCRADLRELVLRCNSAGELLLTLVTRQPLSSARDLVPRLVAVLPQLRSLWECSGKPVYGIYGGQWRRLFGDEFFPEHLCGLQLQLSPATFIQVNSSQTEVLYRQVAQMAELSGRETVWDLYSGAGTIALYLAKQAASVIGVESYPPAVADAVRNAKINAADNCRFIAGAAEQILPQLASREQAADVAVLDPPRAGCAKILLDSLLATLPERIIYVSCDPATLARDLRVLCAGAYSLCLVQPVDMFPQTCHVETVCLLVRK